jgi:hypothetical protein
VKTSPGQRPDSLRLRKLVGTLVVTNGVYSSVWQERLREAEADLAVGLVQRFEDDDEFLRHLDALADEAGG